MYPILLRQVSNDTFSGHNFVVGEPNTNFTLIMNFELRIKNSLRVEPLTHHGIIIQNS